MSSKGRYSKKPQSVNDNIYYYESSDGISVHSWDAHDNLITHFVLPWRLLVTSVERHMYVNNSKLVTPTTQPRKAKAIR